MNQPRISVITPSLNQGQYLEQTICSVLDQGYDNLEYLVADGGSTDESVDILRRYEPNLAWWTSTPDNGPAEAINRAVAQAKGDYIAILPSDDLYLAGALELVAQRISAADHPQWIVGNCLRIDARDQMLGSIMATLPTSLASYLMHDTGLLPLAGTFLRRDLVQQHGRLDAAFKYAFDYEYWCRLLATGMQPTVLSQPLAARREHDDSASTTKPIEQGLEYVAAARKHGEELPLGQRYALWRNCDYRQRIFTLAQAEMRGDDSQRFLWQQLLRRPWWLMDESLWQRLIHGVPQKAIRPAA